MRIVTVNGDALTIEDVVDVALGAATEELDPGVAAVMEPSRSEVATAIEGDAPVYGVNTGFGALADTRVGVRDRNGCRAPSSARTRPVPVSRSATPPSGPCSFSGPER